jgi:arylsulfatase A-like enzyme
MKNSGRDSCSKTGGACRAAFTLAALIAISLVLGCGESKPRPNVILIGVDTLRRDHLGCYGYGRATSPNIDDLARRGSLFEHAVASSPWTLPSFATVFTSLYPSQHGAKGTMSPMGKTFPTLASVLRDNGYTTGATVNAPFLKDSYGVARGFDFYDMASPEDRVADGTTDDALGWIDTNGEEPFLLFVHYFDPHLPYSPPAPYDTLFCPHYSGTVPNPYDPTSLPLIRDRGFKQLESLSPEDWNRIESLYDGEIAFADASIGALLEGLDQRGLLENTLIVFMSDHGEEFFEHYGFEHGHTLYEELIKIPLMFSLPGTVPEDRSITRQVRLVDVMPTILDMLDIPVPTGAEGVSLLPLMAGSGEVPRARVAALPPEIAFSEALLYGQEQKSLSAYPWKLIYNLVTEEASLYNLAEDAAEHENLSGQAVPTQAILEKTLFELIFGTSDTWFLEMAGGEEPHRYDIRIEGKDKRGPAPFSIHKFIDTRGNILPTDTFGNTDIKPSGIDIRDLHVKDRLVLAFKMEKSRASVGFDIRIDGEPATSRTFIGASLSRPASMPFVERSSGGNIMGKARAADMPAGPYCLIWMDRTSYGEGAAIELDEATKRELRSLGYIQ